MGVKGPLNLLAFAIAKLGKGRGTLPGACHKLLQHAIERTRGERPGVPGHMGGGGRGVLGSGPLRPRPAPSEVEGVGETSPQVALSKEGDTSTKPALTRVQTTVWETCPSGFPSPGPKSYH